MKRKKFFCIALASVLALSTAFFAACDDKDDDDKGDNPDDPVDPTVLRPVSELYPDETKFDFEPLYNNSATTGINGTHDPVMVEAFKSDGTPVYYVFSTDNDASGYGVPVRTSPDMIEWEKVGSAIPGYENVDRNNVKTHYQNGKSAIDDIYQAVKKLGHWNNTCWTLWAPDVIPAPDNKDCKEDGGWWLYSCWTAKFGSDQSVIFKLSAQNVAGPYTLGDNDGIVVQHSSKDIGINEIDPSLFWDKDGEHLYMSYGSFAGGIAVIELDATTGLRKAGETADDPGTKVVGNGDIEGSVVSYHDVNVYTGDIGEEDEDESKWEKKGQYYMMASRGSLAYNYNMRTWTSETPTGTFTSVRGTNGKDGLQIASTWSWTKQSEPTLKDINYYIPGHNDMLTTKDGRNLIAYHTRVATSTHSETGLPCFGEGEHFLYTSLFDFNSKGQIVINPNRYAGERIGIVTADDVMSLTNGKYSVIKMSSDSLTYTQRTPITYAQDCEFHADGTITGAVTGTWKVYGTHYVYINLGGVEYYGSAMPAFIRQYDQAGAYYWKGHGGLTISAVTDTTTNGKTNGENGILYFNMQF